MSTRARQLIRNPQTFYRAVHRALGFTEVSPKVLRPTQEILPNTKIGNFALKLKNMEDFFHQCEDTIKIDKNSIHDFNSASSKSNFTWDKVFSELGSLLNRKLIFDIYENQFLGINTNSQKPAGIHFFVDEYNQKRYIDFGANIVGGFQNAFALILGLAKIIPRKLLEQSKRTFNDINEFKDTVKKITRENIKIILGFSKLEMSLFFKLLGILGDNHNEFKLHYAYEIDPAYFDFDKIKHPTRLLPLKSLSKTLIDRANSDGY